MRGLLRQCYCKVACIYKILVTINYAKLRYQQQGWMWIHS